MPRPPGHADTLMLTAGVAIAREHGCSAVRVRDVVDRAGVNLGMFHYHFKSRKRFTQLILKEIYGEFFDQLTGFVANTSLDPMDQLGESCVLLGQFIMKNRQIFLALLKDIFTGEPDVLRFAGRRPPPHIVVIQDLLQKCIDQGIVPREPIDSLMRRALPLLFGSITHPLLMSEVMKKSRKKAPWFNLDLAMSDKELRARIGTVLRGLRSKEE